jgi:hypothetical protein
MALISTARRQSSAALAVAHRWRRRLRWVRRAIVLGSVINVAVRALSDSQQPSRRTVDGTAAPKR